MGVNCKMLFFIELQITIPVYLSGLTAFYSTITVTS
jgi:hypothetical protein